MYIPLNMGHKSIAASAQSAVLLIIFTDLYLTDTLFLTNINIPS